MAVQLPCTFIPQQITGKCYIDILIYILIGEFVTVADGKAKVCIPPLPVLTTLSIFCTKCNIYLFI